MTGSLEPYKFQYTPEETDVHAALGKMLVTWNNTEDAARRLLVGLCGGQNFMAVLRAEIVTRELGSRGLTQAIQTFANDVFQKDTSDALLHSMNYFDHMLEYRNHYTHGITSTVTVNEIGPCGFIHVGAAKGTLTQDTDIVPVTQK